MFGLVKKTVFLLLIFLFCFLCVFFFFSFFSLSPLLSICLGHTQFGCMLVWFWLCCNCTCARVCVTSSLIFFLLFSLCAVVVAAIASCLSNFSAMRIFLCLSVTVFYGRVHANFSSFFRNCPKMKQFVKYASARKSERVSGWTNECLKRAKTN